VFDAPEIRALLREAGFRDVRLYGYRKLVDPAGPLTRHSYRMAAVARRPA
jgi:hypothetical protein